MAGEDKPLSTLVGQGWEIVAYTAGTDHSHATPTDNFLLRRLKSHKLLKVRKKMLGHGFVVSEVDL